MAIDSISGSTLVPPGAAQSANLNRQNEVEEETNAFATLESSTDVKESRESSRNRTTVQNNEDDTNADINENNGSNKAQGEPGSLLDILA